MNKLYWHRKHKYWHTIKETGTENINIGIQTRERETCIETNEMRQH